MRAGDADAADAKVRGANYRQRQELDCEFGPWRRLSCQTYHVVIRFCFSARD
jgi:hypothetical protein